MASLKVSSELSLKEEGKDVESQNVSHPAFKIKNIPDVMDKLGWEVAAKFMRKWFDDPYYEMSLNEKLNRVDMGTINGSHIVDDVSFNGWLMENSRVRKIVNEQISEVKEVFYYNGFLGKVKGRWDLSVLSPGLTEILSKLDGLGFVDHKNNKLKVGGMNFSNISAIELDKKTQFNYVKIGNTFWEKATDDLDDVYGALGAFIVKFAITNFNVYLDHQGFTHLRINELGLYIRDTYEFMNDGDDQPLGYWGWDGVLKPGLVDYYMSPEKIESDGKVYYRVTNGSFVQYRNKMKGSELTGDFFVYSNVKKEDVDITIPIEVSDIMEYKYKKGITRK